jgi:rod shape-determining protein MreC
MKGLFQFIRNNKVFFSFLLLEILSLSLAFRNSRYHGIYYFNTSNEIIGSIYEKYNDITRYFYLKDINQDLANQNRSLLNQSSNSHEFFSFNADTIQDTITFKKYIYISARVVNNSIHKRNNFITLNQGSLSGIEPDMAVIGPNGIVGIVKNVSPHFASVISVLNKYSTISVKLKKNNFLGLIIWEGGDYTTASLTDMPTHADLRKGDTLITSGASVVFPENIPVGIVDTFFVKPGDNFYDCKIKLFTNFANIQHVYAVKNLLRNEQLELEKKTKNEINDN